MTRRYSFVAVLSAVLLCGCSDPASDGRTLVTLSGSTVGAEADLLRSQLDTFMVRNPGIRVEIRGTPDAADQRHQLYVQWLNALTPDPDILQLDVVWTPEFAAAGWILPLDSFEPDVDRFFPATVRANLWQGSLYAVPWFVDVGLLYWRTDLVGEAPDTYETLVDAARRAMVASEGPASSEGAGSVPYGFVWQGARYEGLMTVFLEHLHAFGGRILDASGGVAVDEPEAVHALTFMRDMVHGNGITPEAALSWQEEQTRFSFQNGEAVFMRNWPYAVPLLRGEEASSVAGVFAVAPLPAGPGGARASALGGQQLAINRSSDAPEAAWRVVEFLTSPERMIERARQTGQYPARAALYTTEELADALPVPPDAAAAAIRSAVPRPVTPLYTELSGVLQVWIHRALTRQAEPEAALQAAAEEVGELLRRAPPPPAGAASPGPPGSARSSAGERNRATAETTSRHARGL